ncbi:MAG: ATP-binding protein, partial [Anaerolineae bacterium]|nr:ATP-binding protein [Anaerolineae bacterium]
VTGSSSLHLASQTQEPLTGRAWSYRLHPIATCELAQQHTPYELNRALPQRLVFGSYPELLGIEADTERRVYLANLVTSYLYKDVLEIANLRYSNKLRDLLRLLAFQIGQEVSLTELGAQLQMSKETVASYIDLLEQSFVVFRVGGFSRNLRKEVSKKTQNFIFGTTACAIY